MASVEALTQGLAALGFTRMQVTPRAAGPAAGGAGWVKRGQRVTLAVSQASLERCLQPQTPDESGAPWPAFVQLEASWLHAADIFRKNGLPASPATFAQYLSCLARLGLFPDPVHHFYEYESPELLDVALSVNMRTEPAELTPDILRERLVPLVEGLQQVEFYVVFGAALDALREELRQRSEMEKIRLPAQH